MWPLRLRRIEPPDDAPEPVPTLLVVDGDNLDRGVRDHRLVIDWVNFLVFLRIITASERCVMFISYRNSSDYDEWQSICDAAGYELKGWRMEVDTSSPSGFGPGYPDEYMINFIFREVGRYDGLAVGSSDCDFWDSMARVRYVLRRRTILAADCRESRSDRVEVADRYLELSCVYPAFTLRRLPPKKPNLKLEELEEALPTAA